jgi:hypothetical protein
MYSGRGGTIQVLKWVIRQDDFPSHWLRRGHDPGRRRKHIAAMIATTVQGTTTGSLIRLATAAGLSSAGGDVKTWGIVGG